MAGKVTVTQLGKVHTIPVIGFLDEEVKSLVTGWSDPSLASNRPVKPFLETLEGQDVELQKATVDPWNELEVVMTLTVQILRI